MGMDRKIKKPFWTVRKIIGVSLAVAFVGLVFFLFLWGVKSSSYTISRERLGIATVSKNNFQEFIPIDGVVLPQTTIYIDAIMGGNVQEVFVEDGTQLSKGDPILRLVNTNLELSYMEQETRIFEAINNLQNTKIALEQSKYTRQRETVQVQHQLESIELDFVRQCQLYADSLISDQQFEQTERDYRYSRKQLEIALQLQKLDSISGLGRNKQIDQSMERLNDNLDLLKQSLSNLTVRSPAEGQLSSFNIEVGQAANVGEHLGQIDVAQGFKLRANIDERYISRVNIGQEANYLFENTSYLLHVQKIYSNVSAGTFQVDLLFEDDFPAHIKRGQTLQLRLKFGSQADALTIKRGGFFQQTGGNWIFVLDPTETFAVKRNIRINRQNTLHFEVTEGLEEGEKVIVSSYEGFENKEKIRIKD